MARVQNESQARFVFGNDGEFDRASKLHIFGNSTLVEEKQREIAFELGFERAFSLALKVLITSIALANRTL